jgi:hypothetical protein
MVWWLWLINWEIRRRKRLCHVSRHCLGTDKNQFLTGHLQNVDHALSYSPWCATRIICDLFNDTVSSSLDVDIAAWYYSGPTNLNVSLGLWYSELWCHFLWVYQRLGRNTAPIFPSCLEILAILSSETLVTTYKTKRQKSEDHNPQFHPLENLRCHDVSIV